MPDYSSPHQDNRDGSPLQADEVGTCEAEQTTLLVPPHAPGIYQIRCIPTGKIYVGSARNLWARWGQHRRSLRRGTHSNIHLQRAWDKHGEASFDFSILELVEVSDLLAAEQVWIDRTGCVGREFGYNISGTAGSPGAAIARTWEGFVDPDGNEVTITNLFEFCRIHSLDFPSMHRLAMGKSKLKSYKGWSHKNSPRKRDYVKTYEGFIAPGGQPAGTITNLAVFCREHGLDNTHMVAVANGRLYSHRGWTYDNDRQDRSLPKPHHGYINPEGQHVVITNLTAFCREHGLQVVRMHEIRSGKRRSHKGWTWRSPNE